MYRSHVLVCGGTGCTSSHSQEIIDALEREIAANDLVEEIKVVRTGCFGLCALGPIMIVYPEGCFYSRVKVEDIPEIVSEHLLKGRIVTRLLYDETVEEDGESILCAIEDENELQAVYDLIMEQLYEEEEELNSEE